MTQSRRERGKERLEQVVASPVPDPSDAFTAVTCDTVFGALWCRAGLSDRERRLLSLAVVAARGLELEMKIHITGALKSGDITVEEMQEVIIHLAHYAGWPNAALCYRTFRAACAELELEVPQLEEPGSAARS